jgi:hypothetical protein
MGYTKSDGLLVLANGEIIEDPAKIAQQVSMVVTGWLRLEQVVAGVPVCVKLRCNCVARISNVLVCVSA